MALSKIEFVRTAYAAFSTRTVGGAAGSPTPGPAFDAVRAGLAPHFKWRMRSDFPGRSEYGLDELPLMWSDLDRTFGAFKLVPQSFSESEHCVLVELKAGTLVAGTISHIAETAFHVWRFENGLAVGARTYIDRAEALEAAGLQE